MKTATATVVEMKLSPISAAIVTPTAVVTAQYIIGQFDQFDAAKAVSGYSMRDILISTVHGILPGEVKEISLACTGLIEGTRTKGPDGKPCDGDRTAAARKFASWIKSVYGAIRWAAMSEKELAGFASAEAIYAASVAYRKAAGDVDWKGVDAATKEAASERKEKAAAVSEAAGEAGLDSAALLTMTPDQFAALQQDAAETLAKKAAIAKLEALEKKAKKIAADLVKAYSLDDAEGVLKRALEMIATGEVHA